MNQRNISVVLAHLTHTDHHRIHYYKMWREIERVSNQSAAVSYFLVASVLLILLGPAQVNLNNFHA